MWPWIKRWRDWAIRELWPMYRIYPQTLTLRYSYQKAGLLIFNQPIPWNAEKVQVEVDLRLPNSASRRKADYRLRLAESDPIEADDLQRREGPDLYCARFSFLPPGQVTDAVFLYRGYNLGQLTLPYLAKETFLEGLTLKMPTVSVRMGEQTVVCQKFVSSQSQGFIANAILEAPRSLAPVNDLDLHVAFRNDKTESPTSLPASFCQSQLGQQQLVFSVEPRKLPRRISTWTVEWKLGETVLASQEIEAISYPQFQRSLRICDSRFVVQDRLGKVDVTHQIPTLSNLARVGPCFFVHTTDAGAAGLCEVRVTAQVPGAVRPPPLLDEEMLITDVPTMIAPGTLDAVDLEQVTGFELFIKNKSLGLLSLRPAPTAKFTNEGGFAPPQKYTWSPAAELEMIDRLQRLMDGSKDEN